MAINVVLQLDDVGLFKKRRPHELRSQYERACEVRDQFAECMSNALGRDYCYMPELCAQGHAVLSCAHLHVDYRNFSGNGIPLTGPARKVIDARLRAIGTLVYRDQNWCLPGSLPGDIHVPALSRIAAFPAGRKRGSAKRAKGGKNGGFLGRLFGFG